MNIQELKSAIIPALTAHCNAPVIMADDVGDKPTGPHATYKITLAYGKGVGQAEERIEQTANGVKIQRVEEYRTTISFSSYAMDEDESSELAQAIYDWFAFDGYAFLEAMGVVVSEQTDITNRDAFIVENYERRHGFDVILKVMRVREREVDWFDSIGIKQKGGS